MILRIGLVLLLSAIAYLSLTPSTSVSVGNDKVGHFIAYGTLMINIGLVTLPKMKHFRSGIIFAICYGMLMETGQYFVPGRTFSMYDMLANVSGVGLGIILSFLFGKSIQKRLKKWKLI
ncbi:MAG: VanZ family protein [Crocinitomicaceae bacterium]|jgi:VanZ family protein|nr:VanZ family protein [Crocinitomicaceae bacterium]MDC1385158.1 VanZ family protein [Crocinitomicaceae bacterium]|tara:strand:+ start:7066 stop:7422 length:357 start_codon:yes stop_codon:yes gene_type:complete